jgi:hypothetical protein
VISRPDWHSTCLDCWRRHRWGIDPLDLNQRRR